MLLQFVILIVSLVLLGKSAHLVMQSLVAIGKRLRLSDFVIGFFVLGLATSLPEFLVGMNAVADDIPQLSFGNLIGASLVLFTLVSGLAAVVNNGVGVKRRYSGTELSFVSLLVLLPILLAANGILSKTDGLLLIAAYAGYVLFTFLRKALVVMQEIAASGFTMIRIFLYFIFGTIGMFVFSNYAVDAIAFLAGRFQLPLFLTGLLVLGVGTNLPELALAFRASREGHRDLVLGDILGSAAANTLIVGFVAFLRPFSLPSIEPLLVGGLFLVIALILFGKFARSGHVISSREGWVLVGLYILFVLSEILSKK
jgi:cation:H+ antiporter